MSNTTPKTVLIVDDDKFVLDMYSTKFEQQGLEVLCAENGEQMLTMLENTAPDIILLDIIMPQMDGVGALKKAREKGLIKENTKLIILSNQDDPKSVGETTDLGINGYILKSSHSPSEIVDKCLAIFNGSEGGESEK